MNEYTFTQLLYAIINANIGWVELHAKLLKMN
jgi:hypothetical protein